MEVYKWIPQTLKYIYQAASKKHVKYIAIGLFAYRHKREVLRILYFNH